MPSRKVSATYVRVYAVVKRIPHGRVATYGQVATLAGIPGAARQVGYALNATPEGMRIPWQRVINAQGTVSPRADPDDETHQRTLLEAEGVSFDNNRVDLERYRWRPRQKKTDAWDELFE
jgi:methylated-DNA-protein-cysteine methyltransferase-like protein